jgi:hypothetical protein
MPVIVDQTERRPSWDARNIWRIRHEYQFKYVLFLPVIAMLPSVVNETVTMAFLCLRNLYTTAPRIISYNTDQ